MLKQDAVVTGYIIISILSTLLLIFILYIFFYKTPKEMKTYRWLLVNIQISAYVECMYWMVCMTPISEVYPFPHIYFIGLWYKAFGTSVKTLFAIETYLHCLVGASLMICVAYRYKQLCAFETHWFYRLMLKDKGRGDFISVYILVPLCLTPATYIGVRTDEETRSLILKWDPQHDFPSAVTTFSDQAYWWALLLLLSAVGAIFSGIFQVFDSDRILRTKANSNRTAALHKEAIIALITQTCLMESVSLISSTIMGAIHFISQGKEKIYDRNGLLDTSIAVAVCFFSLKSITCSLAIVLVHKPYRLAVKRMIWKDETGVIMASNVSSDPTA